MRFFSIAVVITVAVTATAAAHAQAEAPAAGGAAARAEYDARRLDVVNDRLTLGGEDVKPSQLFHTLGREDLVAQVRAEQEGAAWMGVGIGAGGCLGLALGYAGVFGFAYAASQAADDNGQLADEDAWLVLAGIGSGFTGFALLFGGLITGAIVAVGPQLSEPWPLTPDETQKLADDHNAALKRELGLTPTAMRF